MENSQPTYSPFKLESEIFKTLHSEGFQYYITALPKLVKDLKNLNAQYLRYINFLNKNKEKIDSLSFFQRRDLFSQKKVMEKYLTILYKRMIKWGF